MGTGVAQTVVDSLSDQNVAHRIGILSVADAVADAVE